MNLVNVNYSIQNLKNKKMSDWKNLQKQALGGDKKVQLKKDFNFEVQYAKNVEGKPPMMVEYKLTEGVAEYINHPSLKGVYVGSFMIIEAWDDSAKVKYQSSPYFTNDNHVWINDKNKAFGGQQFTPEEAKNALGRKGLNTTTKMVIVMATLKGVVTIKTNSTLWINQFSKIQRAGIHEDYVLDICPIAFDPANLIFNKLNPDYYKNMETKNYPACLLIVQGESITDKVANNWKLDEIFTNYLVYKDSIFGVAKKVERVEEQPVKGFERVKTEVPLPSFPVADGGEDLPF